MTPCISLAVVAAAISTVGIAAAQAGTISVGALTVSAQSAAKAADSPFPLYDPGATSASGYVSNAPVNLGGATVTFSPDTHSPLAGLYAGTDRRVATSPFAGTNLIATDYFVAEPSDPVNIAFDGPRTSFDLLWGSVDVFDVLTIEFCTAATGVCTAGAVVTGADIALAAGIRANGSTSAFVVLSQSAPFDKIQITSRGVAFEFEPQSVPGPISRAGGVRSTFASGTRPAG
jgi:hypothetical protein